MAQSQFIASEWVRRLAEATDWFVRYEGEWEGKLKCSVGIPSIPPNANDRQGELDNGGPARP